MADLETQKIIISSAISHDVLAPDDQEDTDVLADALAFEMRETVVGVGCHGQRLDLALVQMAPEFSRSYLQQLIIDGAVAHNGRSQRKPSSKVKAGDSLRVELRPTPQSQAFRPEAMALDVVYEDGHILVLNKPAGLVVHPAPGHWSGTLLNGLLARDAQASTLPRAGIVHRLDKDTSGLMVVARTRPAMDRLVQMIAARTVNRQYIALAHNTWQGARTRQVDLSVGRDVKNRLRMGVVDLAKNPGKTARTTIHLLENGINSCLVGCKLHTGRTHQIRVHMSAIGHPLVSDALYGGPNVGGLKRQALHACELAFDHPETGELLRFKSSLPLEIQSLMPMLGLSYNLVIAPELR